MKKLVFKKDQSDIYLLQELKTIEEMPIAYMRGINLDRSIIIIDEAQNISQENMRTILTRLGKDSKMVFLGDERQQDSKGGNGLTITIFLYLA